MIISALSDSPQAFSHNTCSAWNQLQSVVCSEWSKSQRVFTHTVVTQDVAAADSAVNSQVKYGLSKSGRRGTWLVLLDWVTENRNENDHDVSWILSSFLCAPEDWMTFCITPACNCDVRVAAAHQRAQRDTVGWKREVWVSSFGPMVWQWLT